MKQYIFIGLLLSGILQLGSCKKSDFTSTNTDPASSVAGNYQPNYLLTTTQLNYTGSTDNAFEILGTEIGGVALFIQHMASLSNVFYGDKYLLNPGGWGAYFDRAYTYDVKYAVDLVEFTRGNPQYKNLYQVARIMKAMVFERLTDAYGDIPYSQSGLGYYDRIYSPKYDRQKDIYTDLLKEVEQATDSLDENGDIPSGDMFYSAKSDPIAYWRRFGNSLLLRMAMRLTKVDPATAQAYVTKVQGKTMTSNDDNALVPHNSDGGLYTQSRIAVCFAPSGIRQYGKLSKTFVDFLKSNGDPRLSVLSELPDGTTDTSVQFGLPNGYDESASPTTGITHYHGYLGSQAYYSQPASLLVDYSAPSFILTYAESELLLADAAVRWGIGDAPSHYQNGVLAAITELSAYGTAATISDADAQTWYANHPYDPANGLEMINSQFWIATFFNEYEAWSNWRRTGFPILTSVNYHGNVTQGAIPRRLAYPLSERQSNTANYNAAVAASLPNGDNLTSRMWWDAN
jgi:hypothetical protein